MSKAWINGGTDDTGHTSIKAEMLDANLNVLDTLVFRTGDTIKDPYLLKGDTVNGDNSITLYKVGKVCVLKANNLQKVNVGNTCTYTSSGKTSYYQEPQSNNGWYNLTESADSVKTIPAEYLSGKSEFWYNETFVFVESFIGTSNFPIYPLSVGITSGGLLSHRLERSTGLTKSPTTVSNLSYTLVWFASSE